MIELFLSCLCISLVSFGIFDYIVLMSRGVDFVNSRVVDISKVIVMIGIFFLVLAFGHLLPVLISSKKHERE